MPETEQRRVELGGQNRAARPCSSVSVMCVLSAVHPQVTFTFFAYADLMPFYYSK